MIAALALVAAAATQAGPLPGADKVKHFFMSAFVQSVSFSVARAAGLDRANAQGTAAVSTLTIAILKEINDRRAGRVFSVPDLAWDAAGALAAGAILNGTR